MILPIGHESDSVRRLPWISLIIMAICFGVHMYTASKVDQYESKLENVLKEIESYYFSHTYLDLDPDIEDIFFGPKYKDEFGALMQSFSKYDGRPKDKDIIAQQQETLDGLVKKFKDTILEVPFFKWGYIPTKKSVFKLISHIFIHGNWLHLLGNLFFLYLCGPFIEDVWGKPIYAVFYLAMGIVAAEMFSVHYPNSTVPMVGASGAIAGVMGAFLIRFWNTKIKFFFMFSVLVRGTFNAPAWLMLPLWVVNEFFNARWMDSIVEKTGGSGVAHWAHIWGFLVGAAVAVAIKFFKVEEKFVAPKIQAQTSYVNKSFAIYEEAIMLIDTGKKEEAYAMLKEAVSQDPTFQDTVEALWGVGKELGKEHEASRPLIMLMEKEVRHNQFDLALRHYRQLIEIIPDAPVNIHSKIAFIEAMVNQGESQEAENLVNALFKEMNLDSPPGLLLDFCHAVITFDLKNINSSIQFAEKAIKLALQHPGIPQNKKEDLKAMLSEAPKKEDNTYDPVISIESSAGTTSTEFSSYDNPPAKDTGQSVQTGGPTGMPPRIPVPPAVQAEFQNQEEEEPIALKKEEIILDMPKNIKVTRAVPLAVKGTKITLNVDGAGQKAFLLDKIQAISVAKISPPSKNPFLLLDLFIDDPTDQNIDIRTIRFFSTTFNPQKFVPNAQNPLDAFKVFTTALLKLSGAKPYPDLESVQLKKIKVFPTIKEYEDSI